MTTQRTVKKNLIAQEDLLIGENVFPQVRNGGNYNVTGLRFIYPVNSIGERDALDTTKYTKCRLYSADGLFEDFEYYNDQWNELTSTAVIAATKSYVTVQEIVADVIITTTGATLLVEKTGWVKIVAADTSVDYLDTVNGFQIQPLDGDCRLYGAIEDTESAPFIQKCFNDAISPVIPKTTLPFKVNSAIVISRSGLTIQFDGDLEDTLSSPRAIDILRINGDNNRIIGTGSIGIALGTTPRNLSLRVVGNDNIINGLTFTHTATSVSNLGTSNKFLFLNYEPTADVGGSAFVDAGKDSIWFKCKAFKGHRTGFYSVVTSENCTFMNCTAVDGGESSSEDYAFRLEGYNSKAIDCTVEYTDAHTFITDATNLNLLHALSCKNAENITVDNLTIKASAAFKAIAADINVIIAGQTNSADGYLTKVTLSNCSLNFGRIVHEGTAELQISGGVYEDVKLVGVDLFSKLSCTNRAKFTDATGALTLIENYDSFGTTTYNVNVDIDNCIIESYARILNIVSVNTRITNSKIKNVADPFSVPTDPNNPAINSLLRIEGNDIIDVAGIFFAEFVSTNNLNIIIRNNTFYGAINQVRSSSTAPSVATNDVVTPLWVGNMQARGCAITILETGVNLVGFTLGLNRNSLRSHFDSNSTRLIDGTPIGFVLPQHYGEMVQDINTQILYVAIGLFDDEWRDII